MLDIAWFLVPGKNVIAVAVTGDGATPPALIGKLVVDFDDHPRIVCPFDASWKVSPKVEKNWNAADFDDSRWQTAAQLGDPGDRPWGAIAVPGANDPPLACPLFRKDFQVHGAVRRATLYGSALGFYQFYINGHPVADNYFTPGWTDYKKRVYYQTYDVTDLLRADGPNAIGGILAGGWYYGAPNWLFYGDRPRLFGQLELEMADGPCKRSPPTARGRRLSGRTSRRAFWPAKRTTPPGKSPAGRRRPPPAMLPSKRGQSHFRRTKIGTVP